MTTPQRVNKLKAAMQGMQGAESYTATAEVVSITEAHRYPVAPSRKGKRVVSAYLNAEAVKQLHVLSAERDTTIQSMMEEAFNDLFRKYGKSAIA